MYRGCNKTAMSQNRGGPPDSIDGNKWLDSRSSGLGDFVDIVNDLNMSSQQIHESNGVRTPRIVLYANKL